MADDQTTGLRFPPDAPKVLDYPSTVGIGVDVLAVAILLIVAKRFDPSRGALTVALLVIVSFVALGIFAAVFGIPKDEETATIVGGIATAFGAVVAYWATRNGRNGGDK